MARYGRRESRFQRNWRWTGWRRRRMLSRRGQQVGESASRRTGEPVGWRDAIAWRRWWAASAVCLLGGAAAAMLVAQSTTLHLNVKLVSVFVNVTDRNGAIVGGLTKNDFAVFEDGRPQKISVFERVSELPLNLTIAVDTSGSVSKDLRAEAAAAHSFAQDILRPQDRMSVMQFATNVSVLTPFTDKVSAIDRGLKKMHRDFATALYDAIVQGSDALGKHE